MGAFGHGLAPSGAALGIDDVAQAVAQEVEAEDGEHQGQAREEGDPPFARDDEARPPRPP